MSRRPLRVNLILVAGAAAIVVAAVLVASLGSLGSPNSTVAPSPTPAIDRFVVGYVRFLDGGSAGTLPGATAAVQRTARGGGAFPASARSPTLRLVSTNMHYLSGTPAGAATITARMGGVIFPFDVGFRFSAGGWRIVSLVPPDIPQLTAHSASVAPVVPAAARRLAHDFVLAYTAYREGLRPAPRGAAPLAGQIAGRRDPLGQITPTRQVPQLESLRYGPPNAGELDATAAVRTGRERHRFDLVLQQVAGHWQVLGFAEPSA